MWELNGLATGIGSLPHAQVDRALDLIFQSVPEIPFWPQLPKRGIREGMVAQYAQGLPCIKVNDKGIVFDPENQEEELEKFYGKIINQDLEYFEIGKDFAQGLHAFYERLSSIDLRAVKFIKCHITGPFTYAASVNDPKGVALLHDPEFMQAIIECLAMKALWQIRLFGRFSKKIIIFLDEPYLGCFGSAFTPINRETVIKGLNDIAAKIVKSDNVLLGVHCCGNTDWSLLTSTEGVKIISFDAFSFLDKFTLYAEDLNHFLDRGGIICWGIVPTQDFTDTLTVQSLLQKLEEGIKLLVNKGVKQDLLYKRLLISPSCGLATLDPDKADQIFGRLAGLSQKISKIS